VVAVIVISSLVMVSWMILVIVGRNQTRLINKKIQELETENTRLNSLIQKLEVEGVKFRSLGTTVNEALDLASTTRDSTMNLEKEVAGLRTSINISKRKAEEHAPKPVDTKDVLEGW